MRRLLLALTVAAIGTGCAAMTVSSHIERNVNFTDYVTYDWGTPDHLPIGDPRLDNNPFFQDHLQGAIEKGLASRGYERAVNGGADLLIHYHASVNQKIEVDDVDHRYGYCYQNCEPHVFEYELGTLVVDVVDPRSGKVVWRGWSQDTMNGVIDDQDRLEKQVDEGVSRMMLMLPRGGAALR